MRRLLEPRPGSVLEHLKPHRAILLVLASALAAPAFGADLEKDLNARWQGRWAIVKAPIASNCDGFWNDNEVRGDLTVGKGRERFEAGELVRVERVDAKWGGRVDVFLELAEQLLVSRIDGPFTLYDAKSCKIQLKFTEVGKTFAAAEAAFSGLLDRFETAPQAEKSPSWNGRRRAPFPRDYEQTLAEYARWKAEQLNLAVRARTDEAISELSRLTSRSRTDPDYAEGYAAGLEKVKYTYFGDCETTVSATFYPATKSGKPEAWRRGYEDGQRTGWLTRLLDRLRTCSVPVG